MRQYRTKQTIFIPLAVCLAITIRCAIVGPPPALIRTELPLAQGKQAPSPALRGASERSVLLSMRAAERRMCRSGLATQHTRQAGRQACDGPFSDTTGIAQDKRRVALVVRGEAFRRGLGQYDRHIAVIDSSWEKQRQACESHVKQVVEPLEACGFTVDVFLVSYTPIASKHLNHSNPVEDLVNFYHGRVTNTSFIRQNLSDTEQNQVNNYAAALDLVAKSHRQTGVTYDGLLIIRCDVIFKKSVPDLENVDWMKVLFAFHEWGLGGGRLGNVEGQRVPDTVIWFPWIYANCAVKAGFREHNSFNLGEVTRGPLGFMVDEQHDANSMIDWNPLYRLIRPEQKFDIHGGFAILVAGVRDNVGIDEFQRVRDSLLLMRRQGDPPLVPADIYVHHSTPYLCSDRERMMSWDARDKYAFCSGYQEGTERLAHGSSALNVTLWNTSLAELLTWGSSLLNTTLNMQSIQIRDKFIYDRVFVVRDDYEENAKRQPGRQLEDYDVAKVVYANFGSAIAPWVPSFLILSPGSVGRLAASVSAGNSWPVLGFRTDALMRIKLVSDWIERGTGMKVVEDPTHES